MHRLAQVVLSVGLLISGIPAGATTLTDAAALKLGVSGAKKILDEGGLNGLMEQTKGLILSAMIKPDRGKALTSISYYTVGSYFSKLNHPQRQNSKAMKMKMPMIKNESDAALDFFSDRVANEVIAKLIQLNVMTAAQEDKFIFLCILECDNAFLQVHSGALLPKLEFSSIVSDSARLAKKKVETDGMKGLVDLCIVKDTEARTSHSEKDFVEFISLLLYGVKMDASVTQVNKLIPPTPYFRDFVPKINEIFQLYNVQDGNKMYKFINGELEDAVRAMVVD